MFCSKRRRFIRCSHKKQRENGVVLNGTVHLLLPLDALQARPTTLAYYQMKKQRGQALRVALGRLPSGGPATLPLRHYWTRVVDLSPLFPPYKYQGTRGERRRETEERTKEGRKKKQKGNEKTERMRGKENNETGKKT